MKKCQPDAQASVSGIIQLTHSRVLRAGIQGGFGPVSAILPKKMAAYPDLGLIERQSYGK